VILAAACAALPNWLNHLRFLGLDISIAHFLNTYGYLAVFLFIAIENLGVPFPGETMLVAASVFAAQSCGLQEVGVIAACIAGSIVGSTAGFYIGRTGGRGLIRKLRISDKHLEPAEAYFVRYGSATVFFGRFLAVLRAWAAFLAGLNRMNPIRFMIYNSAGAIIWSTLFGLLGYALGKNLDRLKQVLTELGTLGTVIIVVIVVVIVVAVVRHRRAVEHAG
jgi:membrane protein DedA with SNARE-associated domain